MHTMCLQSMTKASSSAYSSPLAALTRRSSAVEELCTQADKNKGAHNEIQAFKILS